MRRISVLLILLFSCQMIFSRQQNVMKSVFKAANEALKTMTDQARACSDLNDSILKHPSESPSVIAKGYYLCASLKDSEHYNLNLNAYTNQNLDTAAFFQTCYDMFGFSKKCYDADDKGDYRKKIKKLETRNLSNLLYGGRYWMKREDWSKAYNFFDTYIAAYGRLGLDKVNNKDLSVDLDNAIYWATVSAVKENSVIHTLNYVKLAIDKSDSVTAPDLNEYLARCYVSKGDTAKWIEVISNGTEKYTSHTYFYKNLMSYYRRHGMIDNAIHVTDSLLRNDSLNTLYWETKSVLTLAKSDYKACIESSDSCLRCDSVNVNALYNKGISYLNLALEERKKNQRLELYRNAMTPLEKLRAIDPDDISKWGSPLYRIYLNLNMGKKFNEIDKLLSGKITK